MIYLRPACMPLRTCWPRDALTRLDYHYCCCCCLKALFAWWLLLFTTPGSFMVRRVESATINYHPASELIRGPVSRLIAPLSNFLQGYMKVMTSGQTCTHKAAERSDRAATSWSGEKKKKRKKRLSSSILFSGHGGGKTICTSWPWPSGLQDVWLSHSANQLLFLAAHSWDC